MGVAHLYAKIASHHHIKIHVLKELVKLKGSKPEGRRFKSCPRNRHHRKHTHTHRYPFGWRFFCALSN